MPIDRDTINKKMEDIYSDLEGKLSPEHINALREFRDIQMGFLTANDRSIAIIGSAYLDAKLEVLIRSKLVDDKKCIDQAFEQNGPLGTFSSKITFCYLLGLISSIEQKNMHIVRKIRNTFAHEYEVDSFEHPRVRPQALNLVAEGLLNKDNAKSRFSRALAHLFVNVIYVAYTIDHINRRDDDKYLDMAKYSGAKALQEDDI